MGRILVGLSANNLKNFREDMAKSSTLQKWFFSSFNAMGFFLKYTSEKAELRWALDEYFDFFFLSFSH